MNRPSVKESTPRSGWVEGGRSSLAGEVVGSRPPGSACPSSTSASAFPNSWPPNQVSSTAATSPAQGSRTGAPEFTTTTVRGLAAATRRTSSSWRPGSASDVRSKPSLSTSAVVPTTTTATSLPAASATAAAISSSSVPCGTSRLSCKNVPKPAIGEECTSCSRSTVTDWPAARLSEASRCGGGPRGAARSAPRRADSGSSATPGPAPCTRGPARTGDAQLVDAGLGGLDHAADLEPGDPLGRMTGAGRAEPAHPAEHGAVALLGADQLTGRREEPDLRPRGAGPARPPQPGRAGGRGPQVPERPRREPAPEPGGAQALERGAR